MTIFTYISQLFLFSPNIFAMVHCLHFTLVKVITQLPQLDLSVPLLCSGPLEYILMSCALVTSQQFVALWGQKTMLSSQYNSIKKCSFYFFFFFFCRPIFFNAFSPWKFSQPASFMNTIKKGEENSLTKCCRLLFTHTLYMPLLLGPKDWPAVCLNK